MFKPVVSNFIMPVDLYSGYGEALYKTKLLKSIFWGLFFFKFYWL